MTYNQLLTQSEHMFINLDFASDLRPLLILLLRYVVYYQCSPSGFESQFSLVSAC